MADNITFKVGALSSLSDATKKAGQLLFAYDNTSGSIYYDKDSSTRIKFNLDANKLLTTAITSPTEADTFLENNVVKVARAAAAATTIGNDGILISSGYGSNGWGNQLWLNDSADGPRLMFRSKSSTTTWDDWSEIYTSSSISTDKTWRGWTADLSDTTVYDENTWYPVVGQAIPITGIHHLKCAVQLNSGSVPSWCNHTSGFTCNLEVLAIAGGWGTTGADTILLNNTYKFVSDYKYPVTWYQMTNSSRPVFYCRGGGKYMFYTDYPCVWTIKNAAFTESNLTVEPVTSQPSIDRYGKGKISANLEGTADYIYNILTNPTSRTSYYIPFIRNSGTDNGGKTLGFNNGFAYRTMEGTTSITGESILILGNSKSNTTAGNKSGFIRLMGPGENSYTELNTSITFGTNVVRFPAKSGYLLYKPGLSAVGSSSRPVYIDGTGEAIAISSLNLPGNVLISSTSGGIKFDASNGTYSTFFGIGSGGENRGIYDSTLSRWVVYTDADGKSWLNTGRIILPTTGGSWANFKTDKTIYQKMGTTSTGYATPMLQTETPTGRYFVYGGHDNETQYGFYLFEKDSNEAAWKTYWDLTTGDLHHHKDIWATNFRGTFKGNADTATKLKTAVTLTVGSTGKSFDGSSSLSWSHAQIGATVSNTWTNGAAAGPKLTTTVNGVAAAAVTIPSASTSISGVVTTGTQTFSGVKTFNNGIIDESNASIYSKHFYHREYDTNRNVYQHFYDAGKTDSSVSSKANLRVWDGTNKTFRLLYFDGDGNLSWNWQNIPYIPSGNTSVGSTSRPVYISGNKFYSITDLNLGDKTNNTWRQVSISRKNSSDASSGTITWGVNANGTYAEILFENFNTAGTSTGVGMLGLSTIALYPQQGLTALGTRTKPWNSIYFSNYIYTTLNDVTKTIIQNHQNGNITLSAAGNGLFLGYYDTTSLIFGNSSGQWGNWTADLLNVKNNLYVEGKGRFGTSTASYALNTASFICDSWVRTTGNTGWYNETHAGGWYMDNNLYLKSHNNKAIFINNSIYVGTTGGGGTGLSLYGESSPVTYGIHFSQTSNYGKHGDVLSDWATYFTMNGVGQRGWIYRAGSTNVASISANGIGTFKGIMGEVGHIVSPDGGRYTTTTGTLTGYLKITLPVSWTNCMLRLVVDIYDYSNGGTVTYVLGGYNYSPTPAWYSLSAHCTAPWGQAKSNLTVRFGHDGNKCAIYIGESNTSWNYPQVIIRDVLIGYGTASDIATYSKGWSIEFTTSLGSYISTLSNTNTGYSVNYAGSAGYANTASKDASGNTITSSYLRRYAWWDSNSSNNVDNLRAGMTFAYGSHNAPTTGTIVTFDCSTNEGYSLQIMGDYHNTVNHLHFRNRNGDNNTWGAWRTILDNSNYTDYTVTKTGSGASGTSWGIGITGNAATASAWQTARTFTIGATGKSVNGSSNVSWTPYEMRVTRAQYNVGSSMNAIADHGCELGMVNLSSTDTTINPGGGTSWHHYINMTWSDCVDNNGSTTNEWCTQIANKAGTTDLWVRSRSGGSITDGTAWGANWTRILTGSNYTNVLDSRYLKLTGGSVTGAISITTNGVTNSFYSQNSSYTHYSTSASVGHWFNKSVYVQGEIYAGSSYNQRVYHMGNIVYGTEPAANTRVTGMIWLCPA